MSELNLFALLHIWNYGESRNRAHNNVYVMSKKKKKKKKFIFKNLVIGKYNTILSLHLNLVILGLW